MVAPKNKWTREEEDALMTGVNKHGAGKWRAILNDPEFSSILILRTNVQLKDKWRTTLGSSDRGKAAALEKSQQITKLDTTPLMDIHKEIENVVVKFDSLAIHTSLDDLILEAIVNLKERYGSNKTTIASWIEDQCSPPADFKQLLSDKLKALIASGKLIKVKNKYRRAPTSAHPEVKSSKLLDEEQQRESRVEIKPVSKSQVDAELERMRTMTAREAAAVAARAVAEAEAAMEEAEAATREAEAAEAAAEAAEAYAEAVRSSFRRCRNVDSLK